MQPSGSGADALTLPVVASTLFSAVVVTTALTAGIWVSRDAEARGSSIPNLWGLASVLGPGLVLYPGVLLVSGKFGERRSPPEATDRAAGTWTVAGVAAVLVGAVLSPPDPIAVAFGGLATFAVALPVAYLLVFRRGYRRILGPRTG